MFKKKPVGRKDWREFVDLFDNEKVYTRRELAQALEELAAELQKQYMVNRIIARGKDADYALQILSVHKSPDGTIVYVKGQ